MTVKRGKLVIEITEEDGRTNLLKRRDGVGKFLDNIDSMFKRGSFVRAMNGIKMFFVSEEGGTFGPGVEVKLDLSDALPVEGPADISAQNDEDTAKARMSDEGGPEPEDK